MIFTSSQDIADFFGVSWITIHRMREKGIIPAPTQRKGKKCIWDIRDWSDAKIIEIKSLIEKNRKYDNRKCDEKGKKGV